MDKNTTPSLEKFEIYHDWSRLQELGPTWRWCAKCQIAQRTTGGAYYTYTEALDIQIRETKQKASQRR